MDGKGSMKTKLGQYTFDLDGEITVAPTKLSEGPDAWAPEPVQTDLEQWARDTENLGRWTDSDELGLLAEGE